MFIIRVYGIIINSNNELLLTDEVYKDLKFTKFPGGGLDFGEGTIDCLKREFREEFNVELKNINHFYTTDFFQPSAFNDKQQVLSIYYKASLDKFDDRLDLISYDLNVMPKWLPLYLLTVEHVTLPIDKTVLKMLLQLV